MVKKKAFLDIELYCLRNTRWLIPGVSYVQVLAIDDDAAHCCGHMQPPDAFGSTSLR